MGTTFNILDLIFFTFTIIFVLTAFFRGFVKEIFSLLNWVVALTLSYFLSPYATEFLSEHFSNRLVLDGIVRSIIFILAFIGTAMSTSGLRDSMEEKMPKLFDRSLGVFFGFIKTLLIFGFIYALYFNLYGMLLGNKLKQEEPQWLKDAKCYSLLKFSGEALDPLVKKFFDSISENMDGVIPAEEKELDEKIEEIIEEKAELSDKIDEKIGEKKAAVKEETKEIVKETSKETAKSVPVDKDAGYSKKDIEKMNRLIDIIDK